MLEIERKYLLKPAVKEVLSSYRVSCEEMTQFYTKVTPEKSVRFRKIGKKYYKTVKIGKGGIRQEHEKEISKKKYRKNLLKRIGYLIRKKRCTMQIDGETYTLDIFHEPFEGLYLLEIEFLSKKDFKKFHLPDIFRPYLQKEVTEDEAYKNKNLALFGLPLPEENRNKAIDILVQKLKTLKRRTNQYAEKLLQGDDGEDLHQLRVSLRTAISLLDRCAFLCDGDVCTRQKESLKEVIAITNQKRDLDVMLKYLERFDASVQTPQLKDALNQLIDTLEVLRQRESRYIRAYLQASRFNEMMEQYTYFLHQQYPRRALLYGHYAIEPVCDYVILKTFMKIKKMNRQIDWKTDLKKIHKLRILFKKLRYLIENFKTDSEYRDLHKSLKKVQKSLGKLHDAYQQKLIFERLLTQQNGREVQFLLQNIILPSMHTVQREDIAKIQNDVKAFVEKEMEFRKLFVPPAT